MCTFSLFGLIHSIFLDIFICIQTQNIHNRLVIAHTKDNLSLIGDVSVIMLKIWVIAAAIYTGMLNCTDTFSHLCCFLLVPDYDTTQLVSYSYCIILIFISGSFLFVW